MKVKKKKNKPDYFLIAIGSFLLATGILILASVSTAYSFKKFGNTYYFLKHQIVYGLLPGLVLGFIAFKVKLSFIKKVAPYLLLVNLILLILVFIPPIGLRAEGATRWIQFGPISFQPSEFLKITFILYLAAWLTTRAESKSYSNKNLIAFSVIIGTIMLALLAQPDLSTLVVIFSVAVIMYFVNRTPLWHTLLVVTVAAIGLFIFTKISPYHAKRILIFFNSELDPMGMGYQLKQSLIAIGSGGLTGAGLGMGIQKRGLLPQPISDSIFAVFSEEVGFFGVLFLLALFLLFLWRGLKVAKNSKSRFNQLTATGITCWIIIQAFVNIGAMISIFPLTGIPLPFIGYGGSSLIVTLVGTGILLNISKETK